MKTCLLLISASIAMSAVSANAQAQLVYDPSVEAAVNTSTAKLTELLAEAKKQNTNLEEQLKRAGDPASLYNGSMEALKRDLLNTDATIKTNDERATMLTAADGTAVFGRATYGITAAVNEDVTLKDGTVVQRDVAKYEIEGKMLADVDEYRRIRDQALAKKKTLTTELQTTIGQLEAATDFGSIQKYGTLIQLLQGQIASTDRAAEQALHDMEVLDREIKIQSSAARKANAEKAQLERDHNAEGRSKSTMADRETQMDATKETALEKVNEYMTSRKGKNYGTPTNKGPNIQWRKGTDTPPAEETPAP
ncbi:hypothetical protein [Brevifollis gellanilyticus]|uniref:hypothetical protein n=1 Tax=Brevifollis gellanilyticus TaxID=748831 RepID=UPI0011BF46D7|nr:hypothetical protein [Brevifollis gellanilyticus]